MPKTGISLFSTLAQNFRKVTRKAAAYTVLLTDEKVETNGTVTMTLPVLSTMIGTTTGEKLYFFTNVHATLVGTIAAGAGNTIGGRASIALQPGESLIIGGMGADTDWEILWPSPMPAGLRNNVILVASTSGTTPINVIDATGCPVVGVIVSVKSCALDATAANILVKNTNGTICTIAKGTTAGGVVSATTLTTPHMAVGNLLTVESSATNGDSRVEIVLSTQGLTVSG
jgi:hypothetical protein